MSDKPKPKTSESTPVKTIRRGAIAASIWQRQAPSGFEYYDFTLSRSWKAKNGDKQGYSSNFFSRNAAEIAVVVQEASDWIEAQQPPPLPNGHATRGQTAVVDSGPRQ